MAIVDGAMQHRTNGCIDECRCACRAHHFSCSKKTQKRLNQLSEVQVPASSKDTSTLMPLPLITRTIFGVHSPKIGKSWGDMRPVERQAEESQLSEALVNSEDAVVRCATNGECVSACNVDTRPKSLSNSLAYDICYL
eukprot:1980264-Amphidinium_carterae.1